MKPTIKRRHFMYKQCSCDTSRSKLVDGEEVCAKCGTPWREMRSKHCQRELSADRDIR